MSAPTPRHALFRLMASVTVTVAVTALFTTTIVLTPTGHAAPSAALTSSPAIPSQQIQRGAYLARAGDCMACHTVKGKAPFSGGLAMNTPFGTIYSSNITPDKHTGIGNLSLAAFSDAVRHGKGSNGKRLYPAMPYTSFARLSDDDIAALYAYFMQGVAPVQQDNPKTVLPFPFNMRFLMTGWNLLFFENKPFKADPTRGASWNRGAYLVQGLGHCGACHTPHGRFGQEMSSDGSDDSFLSGNTLDNWHAPSLRMGAHDPQQWNARHIAGYLRSGRTQDGAAFGAMSQVINDSTQYLSDADLLAVGDYLTSLPGKARAQTVSPTAAPVSQEKGDTISHAAIAPATMELRSGKLQTAGAVVYLNNCNACHRSDGSGAMKAFPALGGNAVVNVGDPTSLIHLVLSGSAMPSTGTDPTPMAMPGFGARLSDQDIAEVITFIRGNWGNHADVVTAAQVNAVRTAVHQ